MNPIVLAIPVFLVTMLVEAWLARRRALQVYDLADAVTSLHLGVMSQVTGLLVRAAALGVYAAVYDRYRATTLPADSLWLWAAALLAYDFCYYWLHRMGHEVGVLWAAHVVHHSSEYYNLSTALRQTSSGALLGWIFYLPMAVAGVPPLVLAGVALIDLLYQYWVHTELIGRLGWLDRVLVTPSNHRVHHGQNDYCIDKNYGGILILWDRLFGTFIEERADERIVYGVRTPLASFNPLWGNLHYYAELWQAARAAPGWRAKIGVWVAPPGGWSDGPIDHFEAEGFRRFSAGTPAPLRWYAALQFAVLVPFVSHFIAVTPDLATPQACLYAALIVGSTLLVGALLEGRAMARFEQARTLALGLAFALLPSWFGYAAPLPLRAALLLAMLGSAAWLGRQPQAVRA